MLSFVQGNLTNLKSMLRLVEVHDFIYGKSNLKVVTKYFEDFQESLTI